MIAAHKPTTTKLVQVFTQHKDRVFKAMQYLSLFVSWYYQSRGFKENEQKYFQLYKSIFYSRRMYRAGMGIIFLRPIIDLIKQLKKGVTVQRLAAVLMNICKFLFYTLDTVAITMKYTRNKYYLKTRRISFAFFLFSHLFSLIMHTIKLRASFTKERQTKTVGISTRSFQAKLKEIDHERTFLTLTIFSNLGDVFPTMERISVTEEILNTRMNRGTVAFFGFVSASMDLIKAYIYH